MYPTMRAVKLILMKLSRDTIFLTSLLTGLLTGQDLLHRLPVIPHPSLGEMLGLADRESGMVKDDLCAGTFFDQFEAGERITPRIPTAGTPCLDHAFTGHKLDLPSGDVSAE